MEDKAEYVEPEIIYFNVKTNEQLSLYLDDSTYVCYDLNDKTLKRISTKIQGKNEHGEIICNHVISKITFDSIFLKTAVSSQGEKNEQATVISEFLN